MDIPVSRLNQRMALQLPAELPLGLVFVVGQVQLPAGPESSPGRRPGQFYLRDKDYRLPCRLSERAAAEFNLKDGDMVRAGGHLMFEPALASYHLLARDIEHLDAVRPVTKPLTAIIADNSRREQAAKLTPADVPPWVQRMAPPEVRPLEAPPAETPPAETPPEPDESRQADQGQVDRPEAAGLGVTASQLNGQWELLADAESAVAYPEAEPALADLSDELIAFLSQAMDSQVEVEITPEIMTDLNTTGKTERLSTEVLDALDLFEASVSRKKRAEVGGSAEAGALAGKSPGQQAKNWKDQIIEPAGPNAEEPVGESITAAEFAQALAAAQAEPAGGPARDKPPGGRMAPGTKRQAKQASKPDDLIPWYVALLIIVLVVVVLAALIYIAFLLGIMPFDPTLDLSRELPLLN